MVNKRTRIDLGVLLGLAYMSFVDDLNAKLKKSGFRDLGRWYGYVFRALDAEPLTSSALGRRLGMTHQGAMKIVDEMEARGYVERTEDAADGRLKRLRLAPRGRKALRAARAFHEKFEAGLGRARAKKLRAILDGIVGWDGTGPPRVLRPM